jgi:hypothetical protein
MANHKAIAYGIVVFTLAVSAFAAEPPAIKLPEEPMPQKQTVLDRKYLAVMGFEFSGLAADFYSTTLCLRRSGFRETDSWFGSHPSTARLTTESLGVFTAEAFGTYELKKPHDWLPFDRQIRRFWWIYPVANGIDHFRLTYHNMQLYKQAAVKTNR